MRVALIVSLLLAIAAAAFAMQNPNQTTLVLGPYEITASTALVIIVTFVLGALVGILASLGGRMRQERRRKRLAHTPTAAEAAGDPPSTVPTDIHRSRDL